METDQEKIHQAEVSKWCFFFFSHFAARLSALFQLPLPTLLHTKRKGIRKKKKSLEIFPTHNPVTARGLPRHLLNTFQPVSHLSRRWRLLVTADKAAYQHSNGAPDSFRDNETCVNFPPLYTQKRLINGAPEVDQSGRWKYRGILTRPGLPSGGATQQITGVCCRGSAKRRGPSVHSLLLGARLTCISPNR